MTYTNKAYVEHVAVRVKDIHWHIKFFYDVLGMDVREVDGPTDNPANIGPWAACNSWPPPTLKRRRPTMPVGWHTSA